VADFGLSLQLPEGASHVEGAFQGTMTSMAPEVMTAGRVSKASDVYAVRGVGGGGRGCGVMGFWGFGPRAHRFQRWVRGVRGVGCKGWGGRACEGSRRTGASFSEHPCSFHPPPSPRPKPPARPTQFGILLWELYTKQPAFRGVPRALLGHEVAYRQRRPQFPEGCPFDYQLLACRRALGVCVCVRESVGECVICVCVCVCVQA
jgi:serine/threonine protein kinase